MTPSFAGIPAVIIAVYLISPSLCATKQCTGNELEYCMNGATCYVVDNEKTPRCACRPKYTGLQCGEEVRKYYGIDHLWLPSVNHTVGRVHRVGTNALNPREDLNLTCSLENPKGAYRVEWFVNDKVLNQGNGVFINHTSGDLHVKNPSRDRQSFEGSYHCSVTSEIGTMHGPFINIKVKVMGEFVSPNSPVTVNVTINKPLIIKCPEHTYTYGVVYSWLNVSTRANPNFDPKRVVMDTTNGTLYFSEVTTQDLIDFAYAKGIQCRMMMGEINSKFSNHVFLSKIGLFTKPEPPGSFNYPTSDVSKFVTVGDFTDIHCFPYGSSPITISWFKDSKQITTNRIYALQNNNRTLRVSTMSNDTVGTYHAVIQSGSSRIQLSKIKIHYFQLLGDFVAAEQKGSVIFDCTLAFFLSGVSNLPFKWYYNGGPVNSDKFGSRYKLHSNGSFSLSQLSPLDTGIYQCFIDGRLANARILFVTGLPLPPTKLTITNCSQRTTNLRWQVIKTPSYPAKSFVVEMSSLFTPTIYTTLLKVDNARQSVELKDLTPWASLRFRVRGKVDVGIGLPSMPSQLCITPQSLPTKYPDKLTATPDIPDGSIKLRWKIFPEIDWNGAGCGFLFFAKPNNTKTWKQSNREPIPCTQTETVLVNLGTYQLTDVKVQVRNNAGSGPESPAVTSYSGQPRPSVAPKNVVFTKVTENSVALKWDAIVLKGGSVDEYMIVYQSGNIQQPSRRRRSILTRMIDKWHDLIAMVSQRQRVRRAVEQEAEPSSPKRLRTKNTYITISGLKPYVLQTVTVTGVNSGGPGFSTTVRTTTLSATYKFFSVAIKFINVTFTVEYQDSLSLPYKRLKKTINNALDVLFKNNFFAESFEVLSFRNGSVVADIQVVGKSPMGQEISKPLKAMKPDLFSPYQFDSNITFSVEPDFMPPNVSVSNGFPASGDTIEFKCVFILGPRNSSFYWVKDKRQITPGVRHSISHTGLESILAIRKIQPGDEGLYQCGVGKLKFNVSVLSPAYLLKVRPVVSIEPRSLTKVQGESASFSCKVVSGDISKMRFLIVRPKPDFKVFSYNDAITLTGLEITNGNDSQVMLYQCLLVQKETFNVSNPSIAASPVAHLTIVKPSVPKCLQESSDNILWLDTAAGSIDIQRCPRNATGSATRRCTVGSDNKPKWAEPDFGNCTSVAFYNLLLQAEAITSVDYKPTYNASELLNVLENATKSRNLYGGDLSVTVQILQMLTNYSQDSNGTKVTSDKDQQNFVGICSNCLELTNSKRWIQYEDQVEKGTRSLWNRLVVTVDNYGLQLTNQIESSNKLIQTPNIAMRLDKVNSQNQVRRKGLRFRYKDFGSSLYLPPSVFENSQDHGVVSLVYRTLNVVMRLQNDTNGTSASSGLSANTTMVTSVVSPPPTGKLRKVKIVLQNIRVVEPVPPRTCVFWKVGLPATWKTDGCELVTSESNKEITTCECDHLTVFASLMDPYGGPIGEKDRRALELISTIGCAISLVAVLLTIIITVFFWRSVKSPRTIVLINICVAIAVVCILVISEGSARQSKVGCIVLAVLLHYFLLAVFCWMLCEGILLYYLIVKVIGAKVEEKIKYFLLFGWGFPLLVVAISLGATQTKGYGDHGDNTACWLSVDNGLIWAFVGPALFVLLINIIVFILVIRQMMGTRHVQSKSRDEKLRMGVKATAVILPLLGITWLFGLLAFNSSTLAFKYIFAIFNSFQGLMIFIFHCLLNQQIKDAVKRKYNKYSSSDSTGSGVPRGKSSPSKSSLGLEKQSGTLPSTLPRNSYEMTRQNGGKIAEKTEMNQNSTKEPDYHEIRDPPLDLHYYENPGLVDNEYNHSNNGLNENQYINNNQSARDYNDGNESNSGNESSSGNDGNESNSDVNDCALPLHGKPKGFDGEVEVYTEKYQTAIPPNRSKLSSSIAERENYENLQSAPAAAVSPPPARPYHPDISSKLVTDEDYGNFSDESPQLVYVNDSAQQDLSTSPPIVSRESSFSETDLPQKSSNNNQAVEDKDGESVTSFEFGPPLSVYSSRSSRSSSGSSQKQTNANEDDDSVGSYTFYPRKDSDSDSTDTMIGEEDFARYLEDTQSIAQESGVGSEQDNRSSSSLSDDEVMLYDLMLNRKQDGVQFDDADQNQVVLLSQKSTTIDI